MRRMGLMGKHCGGDSDLWFLTSDLFLLKDAA